MTETEEAVRRFLAGDDGAFARIVRLWEKKVYSFAWRMLANREDAQDVAQDTFLSVYKSISTLREPGSFSTWLYRIALNHCRARWRSRSDDISLDTPAVDAHGDERITPIRVPSVPAGDSHVETLDLVRKALAGISAEHRMAIILKEYMGLNLEEVAEVMDCPLSTAKSRLYHGLRAVQHNLKRMGARSPGTG